MLAPLLVLLLFSASAAAPFSTEKAYRAARAAADGDDFDKARDLASQALLRTATEDQWFWALKVLVAELAAKRGDGGPIGALELPAKYATSEAAVFRHLALGYAAKEDAPFAAAETLAAKHQPHLLLYVHLARINTAGDYELHARKAMALAKNKPLFMAHAQNALTYRHMWNDRYVEAAESGERAVALYMRVGANQRLATAAGNLGWAYIETGNDELAEELFQRADAEAVRSKRVSLHAGWLNQLGNVMLAREDFVNAEKYYQQALTYKRDDSAILTNIARVQVERGNHDAAAQTLRVSLSQNNVAARIIDARIDIARSQHARAEKKLLAVIAEAKGATRWTAQAHLALLYARVQRNADAERWFVEAIEAATDARKSISSLELSISFYNTARAVFDGYVDFLLRTGRKEDALEATERIRAQNDRTIDARVFAKRTGAIILCYWLGRDRSHVWRVTPTEVVHRTLPPKTTIAHEVERHRKALDDRRGARVAAVQGRKLYDMLVAPVAPKLAKNARVFIVADDALHALNFETLIPPAAPQHYWIEDVIVSNAASLQPPTPRKVTADAKMLLVGDPVPSKEFPRLAQASKEIDTVANHFQRRVVLRGAKATSKAFHAAAPQQFEFLHFAAHGEAVRKRPFDSAVILSPDGASGYRLFARDIAKLKLQARVVTISSCYGAGDRTFAGEGLVGLAWAFSSAGADNVIAALTKVDDSIAPQLMDEMYREIRKGEDAAVALRKAKLKFVRGGGAYSTPRYWAPFVLYSGS